MIFRLCVDRIKGEEFSIPELLGNDSQFDELQRDDKAMLTIARLAPQVSSRLPVWSSR